MVSERQTSRFLTLFVVSIIAVTAYFVLQDYLPSIVLAILLPSLMFGAYGLIVYGYLEGRRGYQDRYTQSGRELENSQQVMRVLALIFAFIVTFMVFTSIATLVGYDNGLVIFGITLALFVVVVQVVDYYAGRDMEMYVEDKKKRHNQYVASLGLAAGKCMSCQREIGDVRVCPHCGYEVPEKEPSSSYIS